MVELVPPIAMASPCTGVCVIGDDDLCESCARTLDEIADWSTMGADRRAAIIARLRERRA